MVLKTQHSMLVSVESLDYAKGKFDARIGNEDPESEEMKELVSSIQSFGIQHALDIRPKPGGRYDVIAGNRRLTAARILRLEYVPARIIEYTPTRALVWAFNDNRARKNYNQLEAAKILLRCYRSIDLEDKHAIMKVKHMYNLKINHPEEYEKLSSRGTKPVSQPSNRPPIATEPTPEFLEIFFDVGIAPNTQYQLLQIVTQIPDNAFEILEKNPKLSLHKAVALTNSRLRELPEKEREVITQALAKQIIDPKINDTQSRHLVNQTLADLEAGRTVVTEDGNIGYGYGSGKGNRSDPEENVDTKQELEKTFDVEVLGITSALMKTIGGILHIQIPKGAIHIEPALYKPALAEFEKNLSTLKKDDKMFCAEQAAIMGRICKAIVDSVR